MSLELVTPSELVKKEKKQILYINAYIWSQKKMVLMKLFVEQELRHRHRRTGLWAWRGEERACGHIGGRKGWDDLREWHWNIHTTTCKCLAQGAQLSALQWPGGVGWGRWVGGRLKREGISSVQFSPTLRDPMNCSTPGLPVHHQRPEFTQTHVRRVSDAIQPSHPLSSPSPPAPNPSQHQSLFQWVNSSHEVAKVLEFQL